MKFNVSSKRLYSYASAVSKVINAKNAVTILNSFLLRLDGDQLTLMASDMENSLEARLTVSEPEGGGSYCIDARRLVDLLKEMPEQGITVEIHEDTLSVDITYPNGNYNLVAVGGSEYPMPKRFEQEEEGMLKFDIPAENIIRGIDNTFFAVSGDTLRPMMTGILCDIKDNGLIFVATDTRKLVRFIDRNVHPEQTGSFILPSKSAQVFKTAFAKEGDVNVTATSKGVVFESESYTFNSVLIKGNFPPYDRVIPTNHPYSLTIDRQLLLNAVRRVGGFVSANHGLIKMSISTEMLTLRAIDNNFCLSAREAIPCSFSGSDMTIGFSAPYLLEILNIISTPEVVIQLSDPSRPGVFTPTEDKENTELLMLLMPMTVTD
ncbi:MAG: DNA polymerase III subunit beta [Muribaculaceae bacterium]|nr:DNA polymerase III subunit beta [Muribaculaceae bacterium]